MTITQDWQFDLNGTTWGRGVTPTGFSAGTTISTTSLSGFDLPDPNSLISTRSNSHGAYITARYHTHRVWVVSARLNTTANSYGPDTMALKALFKTIERGYTVPFSFKLPTMVQMTSNVMPVGVKFSTDNVATAVGWVDFTATMLAQDPRIYSATANSSGAQTVASGAFNCTNAGAYGAPTQLTFTGPLVNPTLTNNTTGVQWGALITLAAGDTLVVNSLLQTVTYTPSGGSPVTKFTTMTAASDWMELTYPNVANSLTLTASSGTGNVVVAWNDTWL